MSNQQKPGAGKTDKTSSDQAHQQHQGKQGATQQNEGEGNRTAARAYNADQHHFAEDQQKVNKAAQSAKKAVDGKEGADLARAERDGAKHAKE